MSAQIDNLFDQLSPVSSQKNSQTRSNNGSGNSMVFANLLQDKLPSNITFSRPGSQLSIPEGAQSEEYDFASNDSNYINNDNDVDSNDPTDNDQFADDDNSEHRENHEDDASQNEDSTPLVNGLVTANQNIEKTGQATAGATENTSGKNANTATKSESTDKLNTNNAQSATKGDNTPLETADIDPAKLQKQQNANSGIKATVTEKVETITSQPSNVLSANSAVAAQSTQANSATGETTSVADMLLETSEEATKLAGNTSAGDAKSQNGSNGNASQNNGQSEQQANLTGQQAQTLSAQASTAQPASTLLSPASTALGSQPTEAPLASSNPAPSSLFGNSGQIASVDSATGGMVIEGQNGQVQKTATPAQTAPSTRPNIPPQLVSDQVSVNIQRAVGQGQDKIQIQLRPYDLGRIEVTMEMAKDGKMTAVITAEKQETLDMLKSDTNSLLQSLNNAGMQTDSSSLSFNLGNQGDAYNQFANGSGPNKKSDEEFNLDGEEADGTQDTKSTMLGLGEEAQADDDGHYDIQV